MHMQHAWRDCFTLAPPHVHPDIASKAAFALGSLPHRDSEASLLELLRAPETEHTRKPQQVAAKSLLKHAEAPGGLSLPGAQQAMAALFSRPFRHHKTCQKACKRRRNPFLTNGEAHRAECSSTCEHEHSIQSTLIKLMGAAHESGHDLTDLLDPVVEKVRRAARRA